MASNRTPNPYSVVRANPVTANSVRMSARRAATRMSWPREVPIIRVPRSVGMMTPTELVASTNATKRPTPKVRPIVTEPATVKA